MLATAGPCLADRSSTSKPVTFCCLRPSKTSKSAAVSPWTGPPSRTTCTGTCTTVTSVLSEHAPADGGFGGAARSPLPPTAQSKQANSKPSPTAGKVGAIEERDLDDMALSSFIGDVLL